MITLIAINLFNSQPYRKAPMLAPQFTPMLRLSMAPASTGRSQKLQLLNDTFLLVDDPLSSSRLSRAPAFVLISPAIPDYRLLQRFLVLLNLLYLLLLRLSLSICMYLSLFHHCNSEFTMFSTPTSILRSAVLITLPHHCIRLSPTCNNKLVPTLELRELVALEQ